MKGAGGESPEPSEALRRYKVLTEERAKKLYEEVMLQYIKNGMTAVEADARAKSIVRKQCAIRGIDPWPWV